MPEQVQPTLHIISDRSVAPSGEWTLDCAGELDALASTVRALRAPISIDGSNLKSLDTVGALYLIRAVSADVNEVHLEHFPEREANLFELVHERFRARKGPARKPQRGILGTIGEATFQLFELVGSLLAFIGHALVEIGSLVLRPKNLRIKEFVVHLEQGLVHPIPIVALVMFLIGIVIAYLFAGQIERYGANIFIVDGVALALCRELSPVIVSIMVAGRTGSAYTAHIGAMRISEEIEAIQTIGLSPMRVLVVPRVLALVVALPLLVFVGDIVGIFGGMLIADMRLGITGATFLDRLQQVLPVRHVLVGLGKAPVFAVFIALIGCRMGMLVEKNARSLGLSTTATVVQSIVSVILLNAFFAVLLMELGI